VYSTAVLRCFDMEPRCALPTQDQDRVRLVVLAAVSVFLVVGMINLWQLADPQQLW
jgi:hypothetical protein